MTPKELEKKWPSVEKKLQTGDILLFHKRKGPLSKSIRWKSKSYWNHTALIFKDREIVKFGSLLIIEAYNHGIEIHKLKKYTDNFDMYDIGVKRFPALSYEKRINVAKNFMLNNIDVPYDYSRLISFFFTGWIESDSTEIKKRIQRKAIHRDAFICSTFVYKTLLQMHKERKIEDKDLKDPELIKLKKEEEITPGMIAEEESFKWIFNKRYI